MIERDLILERLRDAGRDDQLVAAVGDAGHEGGQGGGGRLAPLTLRLQGPVQLQQLLCLLQKAYSVSMFQISGPTPLFLICHQNWTGSEYRKKAKTLPKQENIKIFQVLINWMSFCRLPVRYESTTMSVSLAQEKNSWCLQTRHTSGFISLFIDKWAVMLYMYMTFKYLSKLQRNFTML